MTYTSVSVHSSVYFVSSFIVDPFTFIFSHFPFNTKHAHQATERRSSSKFSVDATNAIFIQRLIECALSSFGVFHSLRVSESNVFSGYGFAECRNRKRSWTMRIVNASSRSIGSSSMKLYHHCLFPLCRFFFTHFNDSSFDFRLCRLPFFFLPCVESRILFWTDRNVCFAYIFAVAKNTNQTFVTCESNENRVCHDQNDISLQFVVFLFSLWWICFFFCAPCAMLCAIDKSLFEKRRPKCIADIFDQIIECLRVLCRGNNNVFDINYRCWPFRTVHYGFC